MAHRHPHRIAGQPSSNRLSKLSGRDYGLVLADHLAETVDLALARCATACLGGSVAGSAAFGGAVMGWPADTSGEVDGGVALLTGSGLGARHGGFTSFGIVAELPRCRAAY